MSIRFVVLSSCVLLLLQGVASAQIVSQERGASASTYFLDGVWGEDPVFGDDGSATILSGSFAATPAASSSGLGSSSLADASQFSEVDPLTGDFSADGYAVAQLYVQGQASADATSELAIGFTLVDEGTLTLYAELGTDDQFAGSQSHDPHGSASVELSVVDVLTGAPLFSALAEFPGPNFSLDPTELDLDAGNYRLELSAVASDATLGVEQVEGSLVVAEYEIGGTISGPGPLTRDVDSISLSAGGTQNFDLRAGAARAGQSYLLLGSINGASPGIAVQGLSVPLTPDAYTNFTLNSPNTLIQGSMGVLNGAGAANATLSLAPNQFSPALVGIEVIHAYAVFDAPGTLSFASNPVDLELVP